MCTMMDGSLFPKGYQGDKDAAFEEDRENEEWLMSSYMKIIDSIREEFPNAIAEDVLLAEDWAMHAHIWETHIARARLAVRARNRRFTKAPYKFPKVQYLRLFLI